MNAQNKKAIVIGCSISGLAAASLLSRKLKVAVIEQKSRDTISGKVCANVVTSKFLNLAEKLGINAQKTILRKFTLAKFYSENSSVELPVEDYEISRKKLLELLLEKAKANGVEFRFETRLLGLEKIQKGYAIFSEKKGRKKIETADYIIAADGALSSAAKKAGLWQGREFWLAMHANSAKINRKIPAGSYEIFFRKKFGYYSYIFPSGGNGFIAGIVASPKDARRNFSRLLKFLGIRKYRVESALIPKPRALNTHKRNLFLLGDAACQVKFTGGGIIPAIESAFALHDMLLLKNRKKNNSLKWEIFLHQLVSRVLSKLDERDMHTLFGIAGKTGKKSAKSRDELRSSAVGVVLRNPRLLKFLQKLLLCQKCLRKPPSLEC